MQCMSSKPSNDPGRPDAAKLTKDRLRIDLRTAMRDRASHRVRALRTLIATLDNAEAVPPQNRHERYVVHVFGDGSAEVPRVILSQRDVDGLLLREAASRRADAACLIVLGKVVEADELVAEATLIDSYLPGPD